MPRSCPSPCDSILEHTRFGYCWMFSQCMASRAAFVPLERGETEAVVFASSVLSSTNGHVISNQHQTRTYLHCRFRKRCTRSGSIWHPPPRLNRGGEEGVVEKGSEPACTMARRSEFMTQEKRRKNTRNKKKEMMCTNRGCDPLKLLQLNNL
jgi:hypothetical protein